MGMAIEHMSASPAAVIEVLAGPFPRMSAITAFRERIAALPGVASVELQRYGAGSISLRVRHLGTVPFVVQLRGLRELGVEVVAASDTRIEVRVRPASPG